MGFVTGWGGLLVLVAAVLVALLADLLRQSDAEPTGGARRRTRRLRAVEVACVVLTLAGAAATVVRFASAG